MIPTETPKPTVNTVNTLNPKVILQLPSSERPKALLEFKQQLDANFAKTLSGMATAVRYYSNASKDELLDYFEKTTAETPLSPGQREIIKEGLDLYSERHQEIKKTRQDHPDDTELFTYLFKKPPEGKIEVVEGPVTLYFRCYNLNDYALIHSQAFTKNRGISREEAEEAKRSKGVLIGHNIAAEQITEPISETLSQKIFVHEEQHAIMDLFLTTLKKYGAKLKGEDDQTPQFIWESTARFRWESAFKILQKDLQNTDVSQKESIIKSFLREGRKLTEEKIAKDEILAHFKEQEDLPAIEQSIILPPEQNGYNPFNAQWRQDMVNKLIEIADAPQLRLLLRKDVADIFVKEYQNIVKKGLGTIETLEKAGFSREQIISMLADKPFSKWEKVTKRLTQDQNQPPIQLLPQAA